jgi:hypothetical protein
MRHALCLLLLALSAAACSSLTDSFVEVKCTRGSECGSGVCDEQAHRCASSCNPGYFVSDSSNPGLVLDTATGLEWRRKSQCCYTQPDSETYCQSLGMRLPTKDEALAITPANACWPEGWATWTSTVSGPGRWWRVRSDGGTGDFGDGRDSTLCVR